MGGGSCSGVRATYHRNATQAPCDGPVWPPITSANMERQPRVVCPGVGASLEGFHAWSARDAARRFTKVPRRDVSRQVERKNPRTRIGVQRGSRPSRTPVVSWHRTPIRSVHVGHVMANAVVGRSTRPNEIPRVRLGSTRAAISAPTRSASRRLGPPAARRVQPLRNAPPHCHAARSRRTTARPAREAPCA